MFVMGNARVLRAGSSDALKIEAAFPLILTFSPGEKERVLSPL